MNTFPRPASSVTDEEYHRAITNHQRREVAAQELRMKLDQAEALEDAAYKHLKTLRAKIAAETLEIINGR